MTYRPDHRPFDDLPRPPNQAPEPTWQLPRQRGHGDDPPMAAPPGPRQPDDGRPWHPHEHGPGPASFGEPTPPREFSTPPHGLARRPGPAGPPPLFSPEQPVQGDLFAPSPPRYGPEHPPQQDPGAQVPPPPEMPQAQLRPGKAAAAESDASFISVTRVAGTVGILVAIMVLVFFLVQALQMTMVD